LGLLAGSGAAVANQKNPQDSAPQQLKPRQVPGVSNGLQELSTMQQMSENGCIEDLQGIQAVMSPMQDVMCRRLKNLQILMHATQLAGTFDRC
jgi:hypothetical protein